VQVAVRHQLRQLSARNFPLSAIDLAAGQFWLD
jgi:hypothetical protein